MMSMIYEGHFYCFPPKTYLDRMDLTIIRPFLYVEEADVIGFKNKYHLPVVKKSMSSGWCHKTRIYQTAYPNYQP